MSLNLKRQAQDIIIELKEYSQTFEELYRKEWEKKMESWNKV